MNVNEAVLEDTARKIAPYIEEEVDTETGLHTYKYDLPKNLHSELVRTAKREHVTLRELLTRAARLYLALDILSDEPGTYYTRHRPGKPDDNIIFPF